MSDLDQQADWYLAGSAHTDDFDNKGWHTDKPHLKCCKTPKIIEGKEVELYETLLHAHCEHPDKDNGHECCGRVTITRKTLVLNCAKCGDAKAVFHNK
jgi:hypothetical protein